MLATRPRVTILLTAAALSAASCASAGSGVTTAPRGVPGFDTRDYPGAAAMEVWLRDSPYRWVGYYLPAPCYTGTSWSGRRSELGRIGWGVALLFVGEQDWAAVGAPSSTPAAEERPPRCTQANLTQEQARVDASSAAAAAAADGFPPATVIYLNVERVESVSASLGAYVAAWFEALLADGRYVPGLYAHERNVEDLYAVAVGAFARRARPDAPRLWVASASGFGLERSPAESPAPWASVWQGAFDRTESWGGVTLRIDANVARTSDPSR